MTSGNLYIIGNKYIVDTYRILGCKGFVFEEKNLVSIVEFIELNHERIGGIPVSYTHLDVYKRQE